MLTTCTRKISFDAGHRVLGHESKCASWHGHTYLVEVTAQAAALDKVGRVIDFSVLKEKIGGWIDQQWDHGFLLYQEDAEMLQVVKQLGPRHKTYILPCNPTAENLAQYLLLGICPTLLEGTGVAVTKIVVHETPNCRAEAAL